MLFNRFPIFISGGAPAPPAPSPPCANPIHICAGQGTAPTASGHLPCRGEPLLLTLPLLPSLKCWDAGAASSLRDTSECSQPSLSFQPLSGIVSAGNGSNSGDSTEPRLGHRHSWVLSHRLLVPFPQLSQSQGLNVSIGHQDRPNTLDPLAVHFPHSSLTPSSHCLHCVACDMFVYVGGTEREHIQKMPWRETLQGGELCPQSLLSQAGHPGMLLPS